MASENFWLILSRLAAQLRVDDRNALDVSMDDILEDLAACEPRLRGDMRETLAVVTARLAILQVRLPYSV
jgi:hypothetical protein